MGTDALGSMPSNMTDVTRALFRLADSEPRNVKASEGLSRLPFETAQPIRRFYAWKGKRSYEGEWWSSTGRSHVAFESLLEREALMALDFDPDVLALAAQPLALLWPRVTAGHRHHVPDFFVRLANGDGRLVDVKHPARIEKSAAQFDLTRAVCREIGWQYEIFSGLLTIEGQNIRWLSGYRQDRHAPPQELADEALRTFAEHAPLHLGVYRVAKTMGVAKEIVLANVYHLLWRRELQFTLCEPLSRNSEVWA